MKTFQELNEQQKTDILNYYTSLIIEGILYQKKTLNDFHKGEIENSNWLCNKIKSAYEVSGKTSAPQEEFIKFIQSDVEIRGTLFPLASKLAEETQFLEESEVLFQKGKTPVDPEEGVRYLYLDQLGA